MSAFLIRMPFSSSKYGELRSAFGFSVPVDADSKYISAAIIFPSDFE